MGINRYTKIQPATFTPMSMQEVLGPAMTMRQSHDEALNKMIDLNALDSERLPIDDAFIKGKYDDLRSKVSNVSNQLATTGMTRGIKDELTNIKSEYSMLMSPSGAAGKALENAKDAKVQWGSVMQELMRQGASPDFVEKSRDIFMNRGYKGVMNPDGSFNPFTPGRTPNYHDFPSEFRDAFQNVGITEAMSKDPSLRVVTDPETGLPILRTDNPGVQGDNVNQLNAALHAQLQEVTDYTTDRGYSAALQGYTPDKLTALLAHVLDAYRKTTVTADRVSGQPLYDINRNSNRGNGKIDIPEVIDPGVSEGETISAGATDNSMWTLNKETYMPTGKRTLATNNLSREVPGIFLPEGKVYVIGLPGNELPDKYRSDKGLPIEGMAIQDVKLNSLMTVYEVDHVDKPSQSDIDKYRASVKEQNKKNKKRNEAAQNIYGYDPSGPDIESSTESDSTSTNYYEDREGDISSISYDQKLADEIDKISRNQNLGGGALVTFEGHSENSSFPYVNKDTKILIDDNNQRYFIAKSKNGKGLVKVHINEKIVKEYLGKRTDNSFSSTDKPNASDYIRMLVPTTRLESLSTFGTQAIPIVGAPIRIEQKTANTSLGPVVEMRVTANQPDIHPEKLYGYMNDVNQVGYYVNALRDANENGYSVEIPKDILHLYDIASKYHVNLATLADDYNLVFKQDFSSTSGGSSGTFKIYQKLLEGIAQSTEEGSAVGQRNSSSFVIPQSAASATNNIVRFIGALEAFYAQESVRKKQEKQ